MVLWDSQGWSLQCWSVKGFFSSPQQLQETVLSGFVILRVVTGDTVVLWPMCIKDSKSHTKPRLLASLSTMVDHIEESHWPLLEKLSLH